MIPFFADVVAPPPPAVTVAAPATPIASGATGTGGTGASALPPVPAGGEGDDSFGSPRCEPEFIQQVYRTTKPSVVRITRPDGALGTGFVFFSPKHVATALHVVDLGRDVRVEFPGGRATRAQVVAVDEAHDLAVLELAESSDATPLVPRENVGVGAPVIAIGNPYGDLPRFSRELTGLLNYSVSQGIVSAKSDAFIQTDAVLSPGNSGGPMLTCDGHVVGVADRLLDARIGFAVPVAHLSKLTAHIGERSFHGGVTSRDGALGVAWQHDASTYWGPYVGGSVVVFDRLSFTTRLGVAFAGKQDTPEPIVDRDVVRFFGELTVNYRMLVLPYTWPTYLSIGLGMFGNLDRGSETRLSAALGPPGCSGEACTATLRSHRTSIKGGGVAPLAQATINFGSLEGSYGFALDVLHPDFSTHRVLVGLNF